jgi:excisionase family DNA binding protein
MPEDKAFNPEDWITTSQAAEMTGYARAYLRQLIHKGRLQGRKLGRDWILSKEEVLTYAKKMQQLGPAKYDPWRSGGRQRSEENCTD